MKKGALTKRRQQVCTVAAFLHTDKIDHGDGMGDRLGNVGAMVL